MVWKRLFRKSEWAPAVQSATGLQIDADFAAPTTTFGILRAWFNGRIYEMDEADQKRLRPVWVRDPRAVRNEQFKAERRAQRQRGSMIISLDDDDEHDPYLPPAEIMPPAPRGGTAIPGDDIGDWIVMPPEGAGDGNPGR